MINDKESHLSDRYLEDETVLDREQLNNFLRNRHLKMKTYQSSLNNDQLRIFAIYSSSTLNIQIIKISLRNCLNSFLANQKLPVDLVCELVRRKRVFN